MERAASELKELKDERGVKLETEMRAAFEDCWLELCAMLPAPPATLDPNPSFCWAVFFEQPVDLQPQPENDQEKPPEKKVIKVNDRRYELPCSICGETAAVWEIGRFKWGGADYGNKEPLVYRGIGGWWDANPKHASKIFEWLDQGEMAKVRAYTRGQELYGFDTAYCPKCDRTYCAGHYIVEHEVDSDDYVQDFATCPRGHRRSIGEISGWSPP